MISTRQIIIKYIDELLEIHRFQDYCPNGLQVEGKASISKIVTAVTASQYVIEKAVAAEADLLLVHHGYFWKGEDPCLINAKKQRISTLMKHDISLAAYHLPLDAHTALGNNAALARLLNLQVDKILQDNPRCPGYIFKGKLPKPVSATGFKQLLQEKLQREPLHIAASTDIIETLVWCSGGAQDYLTLAIAEGVDAYLTGEVSERTYHQAKEADIHFFAGGHHATERYGIQSLGRHLQDKFSIACEFIDEENPV